MVLIKKIEIRTETCSILRIYSTTTMYDDHCTLFFTKPQSLICMDKFLQNNNSEMRDRLLRMTEAMLPLTNPDKG